MPRAFIWLQNIISQLPRIIVADVIVSVHTWTGAVSIHASDGALLT